MNRTSGPSSPPAAAHVEIVAAGLRSVMRALEGAPAYVTNIRGDILAWNDMSAAIYACDSMPADRRNTLLHLFDQPEVRTFIVNWEEQARAAVAAVRQGARGLDDPRLAELVERLCRGNSDFARLWDAPPGIVPEPITKRFLKPPLGELVFTCAELAPVQADGLRLWVYTPAEAATRERLRSITGAYRRRRSAHHRQVRAAQRVRAHLDEHYVDDISLDELAAIGETTRFALLRAFVAEVGVSPHAYQLLVRVDRARHLLAQGQPAADVALAVGFSDQSHLIRQFRRVEGVTPGEYVRSRSSPKERTRELADGGRPGHSSSKAATTGRPGHPRGRADRGDAP